MIKPQCGSGLLAEETIVLTVGWTAQEPAFEDRPQYAIKIVELPRLYTQEHG